MNAHEHTDPHGDGLTITHDDGKMWITCTTAHAEVTVGPLAAGILTDYDMDGGVAAALIEKEAEEPTDGEVLAALNAQGVVVSPKMHPAPSLDHWGDKPAEAMRAALSAARAARRDEEKR